VRWQWTLRSGVAHPTLFLCRHCARLRADGFSLKHIFKPVQVLGELFHRLNCVRENPSRLMIAAQIELPDHLQPGMVRLEEPKEPFPRAGLYKRGLYHAVQGVEGNLVNVCSLALLYISA
jgi:hypothetical protein